MQQPATKRTKLATDDILALKYNSADSSGTHPCLLPLLQPVRHCLHAFLSARDAARLMRASRSITSSLLADYPFVDHVFFTHHSDTVADVKRSLAFYARHRMRILRMCLPNEWNEPIVSEGGQSLLPPSLVALTFGQSDAYGTNYAAFDGVRDEDVKCDVTYVWGDDGYEDVQLDRRLQRWEEDDRGETWAVPQYHFSFGHFNQPIPPGALPHGLRYLQLIDQFNQPLQQGSIPDTVEVLQFGRDFDQPLEVGHLPASLTHLVFGDNYDQPLLPGVLPASLQQLYLGFAYDFPLLPDSLPSQLKRVSFGYQFDRPIPPAVIPSSVTHLRLSEYLEQPLQPGSIPHGVVYLDTYSNQPIVRGLLPSSLRELVLNPNYTQPLLPASLPDGLRVLSFDDSVNDDYHQRRGFQHVLQPAVIPSSVVAVSLSRQYKQQLVAGGIPASVKWLRLPRRYASQELTDVLAPSTRIVYWKPLRDVEQ